MYILLMSSTANTLLSLMIGFTIGVIVGAFWYSERKKSKEEDEQVGGLIHYVDETGKFHYRKSLRKVK